MTDSISGKENGDMSAMPVEVELYVDGEINGVRGKQTSEMSWMQVGLTKRELFATMAMQGRLSSPDSANWTMASIAQDSVEMADLLLEQLTK